ncbi:MAG TPA: hypothetical protein VFQ53_21905 [Kofleriaceae bacterium]|nr:hypothetical protein [Kofleriaceae bacterium]
MKLASCVLSGVGVLVPALALAQPAPAEPAEPADPNAADPAAAPAPDPNAALAPPPPASGIPGWPLSIIDRPLTLNRGLIRAQGDLAIAQVTTVDVTTGNSTTSTAIGLTLSGGYGVTDQLELGVAYGFTLKELEAKGPLTLYGAFRLAEGSFKAAANAAFTYNLASEVGTLSGGLAAQWNLTPEVSLFTPGQQLSAVVVTDADVNPVSLALPLGLGLQASPEIFAYAQSTIATIDIADSASSNIFEDAINVAVGAFYSPSSEVDLGVALVFPDLENAGDTAALVITGRVFAM